MADRFEFQLGVVEALVVGRATGADIRQFPLRTGHLPVDPVRYVQVAKQVYAALEDRRLSVSGELQPGVRAAFELLAHHRVALAVSGVDGLGADIAVLALTDGAQALGITQSAQTDDLLFSLFEDEELVDVITGVLPPAEAAKTGKHSVRHQAMPTMSAMAARRIAEAEFEEEETDAFGNIEVRSVVRPGRRPRQAPDVAVLERVLAEPRLGGGYLVATGTGRHGERLTGEPLSWLDTADGRYLVHTTGDLNAEYVPAGRADVARAVRELIAAVY